MPHALRVNFENAGHTTKNKIFRLVKLLAYLSTRLNLSEYRPEKQTRRKALTAYNVILTNTFFHFPGCAMEVSVLIIR